MYKLLNRICFKKCCSLFIVLGAIVTANADDSLCLGIPTPGVTLPPGDIILEHGSPLEIFCTLNAGVVSQGFNASNLVFYNMSSKVQSEFVNIVNESTARLYIEMPVPMRGLFACKVTHGTEETPVCYNQVTVGFKPQEVLNFSCYSINYESLYCTWQPPTNYVKTEYSLVFYLPGRAGGRFKYKCPNKTDLKGRNYCFWYDYSNPAYRIYPYEYYFFVMTGVNQFGNTSSRIRFHHYAHVIPAKAENLTVVDQTQNSVMLQWSVPHAMQAFPPGVTQKVEYRSVFETDDTWHVANTSSLPIKKETYQLNVTDLEFPNTLYEFRVFMRSPLAVGDGLWSEPATITAKTKPSSPSEAFSLTDNVEVKFFQGVEICYNLDKRPATFQNEEEYNQLRNLIKQFDRNDMLPSDGMAGTGLVQRGRHVCMTSRWKIQPPEETEGVLDMKSENLGEHYVEPQPQATRI